MFRSQCSPPGIALKVNPFKLQAAVYGFRSGVLNTSRLSFPPRVGGLDGTTFLMIKSLSARGVLPVGHPRVYTILTTFR